MSQAERIKEELGWFKVVFAVLAAIDASLVAWLAQNFAVAGTALLLAGLVLVAVLTGAIIWTNRVVYRRLEQLEKL
jgi:hypothetical protein